jgi:hypothetical protein
MQGGKRGSGFNARTNVDDWVGLRTKAVVWENEDEEGMGHEASGHRANKEKTPAMAGACGERLCLTRG